MSSYDTKMRLDSQLSRMNCQTFSVESSSRHLGGRGRIDFHIYTYRSSLRSSTKRISSLARSDGDKWTPRWFPNITAKLLVSVDGPSMNP